MTRPFTRLRKLEQTVIPNYFADVRTFDVAGDPPADGDPASRAVAATIDSGLPVVQPVGDETSLATVPVFRGGSMVSVVVWSTPPRGVGVVEVWQPVTPHAEVRLADGHYGHLERFHNVSSFVRFERGSGLPGMVWQRGEPVLQDDLPNHPGFLRAAGASAGDLVTAVGIPVIDDDFRAAVVLISSKLSPMARGVELWRSTEDGFELSDCAYTDLDSPSRLKIGHRCDLNTGMPAMAAEHGGATTTENPAILNAGREAADDLVGSLTQGLAIPTYHGDTLRSVTVLLN